ncbi:uncharacterized protein LOC131148023 isoform X1 [Malania oleifera]|uniref:uncharacterized protein LOC131148023 isoform X1 n=1 Tax=Malania oleifera TaxID=397392 RepID=UPI0025AE16C5|nr:uncharacterized protein LOC131148023 isoform X1 [Malania oleifera]
MSALNWRHHTLIQSSLSRGPLKEQDFHRIFEGLTGKSPGTHQQLFSDYLFKINKELAYLQFELRGCRNQYDGKIYYGVVNNVADEQSKLGTKYTVPQITFYRSVIEAIAHDVTAQGSISSIDALNIRLENQVLSGMSSQSQGGPVDVPPALKNFSVSQKEKTLDELVRDCWLCSTPDGNIGLGVRSFLDLRSWFHNNDVPSCDVCNEAGVKAELCQNEGCMVRIHQYCLKKKFSRRGDRVCPGCGTQWNYPVSKAEALEEDDQNEPTQSQLLPRLARKKKLRTCKTENVAAGVSGSSQTSVPLAESSRTTRSSARLR